MGQLWSGFVRIYAWLTTPRWPLRYALAGGSFLFLSLLSRATPKGPSEELLDETLLCDPFQSSECRHCLL